MTVLSKIKEIAILRSMGYRRIDICAIFLWQGALVATVGSLLGCVMGAVMTWGVSKIPIRLRGLLSTDYFLVAWDWRHYLWATLLAMICSLHCQLCAGAPRGRIATCGHDYVVPAYELEICLSCAESNVIWAKMNLACTLYAEFLSISHRELFTQLLARRDAAKARCFIFLVCSTRPTLAAFQSNRSRFRT